MRRPKRDSRDAPVGRGGRSRETGCPPRSDAIGWPRGGRNAMAGLRPERVRRDESRLYVADGPCGGMPHLLIRSAGF